MSSNSSSWKPNSSLEAGRHSRKVPINEPKTSWRKTLTNPIARAVALCTVVAGHSIEELVHALVTARLRIIATLRGKPPRPISKVDCPDAGTVAWNMAVYPMMKLEEYLLGIFEQSCSIDAQIDRVRSQIENAPASVMASVALHPRARRTTRYRSPEHRQLFAKLIRLSDKSAMLRTLKNSDNSAGVYHEAWCEAYQVQYAELQGKDGYFTDARTETAKKTHAQLKKVAQQTRLADDIIPIKINEGMVGMYYDLYYAHIEKVNPQFLKDHPEIQRKN